ncbi:hypothetical protein [Dyella caseinilytica]|uniref:hypothetical protein n=1 Tax=Dyella caseinilytica TaxID=1849581 RepID=UPI00193FE192|nr:hypothetical protein [Dyella caseinilytica]GFZ85879.1 hypothetical protein GCM10011408_00200 [Dyella caseinilytica]
MLTVFERHVRIGSKQTSRFLIEVGYTRNLTALQAQKDLAGSIMFEGKAGFMPG